MGKFSITTSSENGIYVVRSSGYIDGQGGTEISDALNSAIDSGFKKFLLNFTNSPLINSIGIAQLIEIADNVVEELNGSLCYVGLSEPAYQVFKMVGLLQLGNPYLTEKEAIADLAD